MRHAATVLFFATTLALVGACSEDDKPDGGLTMPPGSGVVTGDAATGNVPGLDSGQTNPLPGGGTAPGGPGQISQPGMAGGTSDGGGIVLADGGGAGTGGTAEGGVLPTGDGGPVVSSGDPEFDACYAKVKPVCLAKEQNTAELIEQPCKALTNLPVPLTDSTSYGPTTVMGGPYAAKIDWNEGAGTKFVSTTTQDDAAEQLCLAFGIDTFAQPAAVTDELKNLRGLQWNLFTIFRPACMKKGEKYPVVTWANGTCGETHGYSGLLSNLASHGFVVIASNSTWTGTTTTADGTPVQVSAINYAEALNADMNSPLYQRLDMSKVGAMGHSQGAAATGPTAADPRVKAVIFWNTGTSNDKPFLNISGDEDVGGGSAPALKSSTDGASKPGAWVYFHKILATGGNNTGHLVLMEQPERVTDLNVAWWKWQLKDDQEAKKMFVGSDCGLCKSPMDFEYGRNSMLQ
jgi:hypothetical protein